MDEEYLKKIIDRRDKSKRRQLLLRILALIEQGAFSSGKKPEDLLFNTKQPREEYISPADRDSYNSGYMEIGEMMAGTENVR